VILSADVRRFLRVGVKVTLAMQLAFTETRATNRTIVGLREVCRVPAGDGDAGDDQV
jgi:hypothetical protein